MGRFNSVGNGPAGFSTAMQLGASGQAVARAGASNLWTTAWQSPDETIFGRACRRSKAFERSAAASRKEVGGLAFSIAPSSSATTSIDAASMLRAIRRYEPSVLI